MRGTGHHDIAVDLYQAEQPDAARRTWRWNVRPDSPDLIHRHLARKDTGLYAAPSILRQRGEPRPGTAFAGHALVTYQQSVLPGWSDVFCGEPPATAASPSN